MWATSSSADVKVMITVRLTGFNTELERQQLLLHSATSTILFTCKINTQWSNTQDYFQLII